MARALLTHVALPLVASLALVVLYFTPVELIGCANRGMAALLVGLGSAVVAIITAGRAVRAGRRGDRSAGWWLASTGVLLLPVLLLIWPLG
jgi:hypothetical protein